MIAILFTIAVMFGLLPLLYIVPCSGLYLVYRATGGKMGFKKWWKKMEF